MITQQDKEMAVKTLCRLVEFSENSWNKYSRGIIDAWVQYRQVPDWAYSKTFDNWMQEQIKLKVVETILDCGLAIDQEGNINGYMKERLLMSLANKLGRIIKYHPCIRVQDLIQKETDHAIASQEKNFNNLISTII